MSVKFKWRNCLCRFRKTYPSIVIQESGAMSSKVEQSHTGSDTFGADGGEGELSSTLYSEYIKLTVRFPYFVPVLVKG